MNGIKNLKPRRDGRYEQGYINQESCKKLFPQMKFDKIIYRSSYEKKFIYWAIILTQKMKYSQFN